MPVRCLSICPAPIGDLLFWLQYNMAVSTAPMTPELADAAIRTRMTPLAIESRPLWQCVGATLREDVRAGGDSPPSDRVAVDGIAVSSEHRGSDGAAGALILKAGTLLRPPEIAVAASVGRARLQVGRQPSFMIISTGDELIEPGEPIAEHQVRRSNAYGVMAALRARGFARIGDDHLPDDESLLHERLLLHLTTHDVVILSGGVSMGKFDLVPKVLMQLGVQQVFHKVAQRPGKPMWFGIGLRGQAVFGLPGNPVSTLVCLLRYVIPAIAAAMGTAPVPAERVALAAAVSFDLALTYFLPVAVEHDQWGRPWAQPRPTNGSGDFVSLISTDGFLELPPGPATYPQGHVARLYRW